MFEAHKKGIKSNPKKRYQADLIKNFASQGSPSKFLKLTEVSRAKFRSTAKVLTCPNGKRLWLHCGLNNPSKKYIYTVLLGTCSGTQLLIDLIHKLWPLDFTTSASFDSLCSRFLFPCSTLPPTAPVKRVIKIKNSLHKQPQFRVEIMKIRRLRFEFRKATRSDRLPLPPPTFPHTYKTENCCEALTATRKILHSIIR